MVSGNDPDFISPANLPEHSLCDSLGITTPTYTPKLLPTYREEMGEDPEAKEVYVHPKAYCKWHRMVFRGPVSLLGIYSWLL